MAAMNVGQAREQLYPLIRQINEDHSVVEIVGKHGNAILIAADDYAALTESLYLLSTPSNAKWILSGLDEADRGEVVPTSRSELLGELGLTEADLPT